MRVAPCLALFLTLLATFAHAEDRELLERQVRDAEAGFAGTMARRDLKAFASYLADDAVFFSNDSALRGKSEIVAGWKGFYAAEKAPFSWRPETVVVLKSGQLAHSSGPVLDAQGRQVATFNSVWRRNDDGKWQVIFDKGCDVCRCADGKK